MESGNKGNRVLVIDDDPDALESCKDALAQNGFAVTTCAESTQAIPTLKKNTYCAVLLDIRMPGIEGSDLLPLIKKICPDLPVVIVSAYCDPSKQNYYHSLGAFDVLSKPFSH